MGKATWRTEVHSATFALVLTGRVYSQVFEVPEPRGRAQGPELLPTGGEEVQVRDCLSKLDLRVLEGKALKLGQQIALMAKMASW